MRLETGSTRCSYSSLATLPHSKNCPKHSMPSPIPAPCSQTVMHHAQSLRHQRHRVFSVHSANVQSEQPYPEPPSHPTTAAHAPCNHTEYQQRTQQDIHTPAIPSRRSAVIGGLTALANLQAGVPAAHALKTITLRDGTSAEVFEHGMSLSIVSLRGSIPQEWIMDFKASLGKYAGFSLGQRGQLADIYKELSDPLGTKNSACMADVVTLGDAWLGPAIKAGLVQPIPNAENFRWFKWLSPRWRALVRRDSFGRPDPKGDVYAAPYRWGATLIAYRKDRLLAAGGHPINDWTDLLQPALTNRVAMTDSSREFLGAALKAATSPTTLNAATTGSSAAQLGFNTCAQGLKSMGIGAEELADAARKLRKQVRLFSSRDHVRAFAAGDVWAVVGWSQDLITLAERSNMVELIVPASGTALFADLWTIPAHAQGGHMQSGPSPILPSWLEFSLMPARANAQSSLKTGAAPVWLDYAQKTLHEPLASTDGSHQGLVLSHESGYMPRDRSCLTRSEFLLPLNADTLALYGEALQLLQKNNA